MSTDLKTARDVDLRFQDPDGMYYVRPEQPKNVHRSLETTQPLFRSVSVDPRFQDQDGMYYVRPEQPKNVHRSLDV